MSERLSLQTSGSIGATKELHTLYGDFTDYMEVDPLGYTETLLVENHRIFEGIDMITLDSLTAPQRRVFPTYLSNRSGARIRYIAPQEVTTYLYDVSEEFSATISWAARIVILHGLALEMEAERFVPDPATTVNGRPIKKN